MIRVSAILIYIVIFLRVSLCCSDNDKLPTLYDYYTDSEFQSGLELNKTEFTINTKPFTILSGSMHYFRVPKQYYRDRLRKLRACGLNTVETYIPWNLHEPEPGVFDFGKGGSELQDFLDLEYFLQSAMEEDLFVIVRPGPYIGTELDLGGLPSWLLHDNPQIKVRTTGAEFIGYVRRYFEVLISILNEYQFQMGGPIIAMQIDNEYSLVKLLGDGYDPEYSFIIKNITKEFCFRELLFQTSLQWLVGGEDAVEGVLQAASFSLNPAEAITRLQELQPEKPTFITAFRPGWYNVPFAPYTVTNETSFGEILEYILKRNASVNFYMFTGGTNWGFINGAYYKQYDDSNVVEIAPESSSYDYESAVTESGEYRNLYFIIKNYLCKYGLVQTKLPTVPGVEYKAKYSTINITQQLLLQEVPMPMYIQTNQIVPMEQLNLTEHSGQSFGYILYRFRGIDIAPNTVLSIEGRVSDLLLLLVNNEFLSKPIVDSSDLNKFGYWNAESGSFYFESASYWNATMDLLVANLGRVTFGELAVFNTFKGINGSVYLNDMKIDVSEIIPLEFKSKWLNELTDWHDVTENDMPGPAFYLAEVNITEPRDTYIVTENWGMGVVTVNGFVLGRYSIQSPHRTMYWPAALMVTGINRVVIFEHYYRLNQLEFSNQPKYTRVQTV